ncbi:hypothetical protein QNI19_08420 [Cytophagaceae bacterium DM2B3-1]|uniref:Uncharacterized protein n=1 Tax=Xanthocytophaga flava TaxID=3048013 RepID=A0ABT7CGY2_9BACT|nr:hypothetical protein [Xanthocytophaga flavus]MDJ1492953.1 hypothetical protein [Xanthocytophaga flavus]
MPKSYPLPTISEISNQIDMLLQTHPVLAHQRVKKGKYFYRELAAAFRKEVSIHRLDSLLQLVSLECAAGASASRCREWFACMGALAAQPKEGSLLPSQPVEAVIYFALAGIFDQTLYKYWPEDIFTLQTAARVMYALTTGKPVSIEESNLHDSPYWLGLYKTIRNQSVSDTQKAVLQLADHWLHEYKQTDTLDFDPYRYPCFEPDCNAALAFILYQERMQIELPTEKYKRFYVAALLAD